MRQAVPILTAIAVVLFVGCGGSDSAPPDTPTAASPSATPSAAIPSPTPNPAPRTPPPPDPTPTPEATDPYADPENAEFAQQRQGSLLLSTGQLGEPVRVGKMILTVHGLTEAPNQCFTAADPGVVLLDADVELHNVSQSAVLKFHASETLLIDTGDVQHPHASYTCSGSSYLDVDALAPGEIARGTLAFEVPTDTQLVKFRYETPFWALQEETPLEDVGKIGRWEVLLQE